MSKHTKTATRIAQLAYDTPKTVVDVNIRQPSRPMPPARPRRQKAKRPMANGLSESQRRTLFAAIREAAREQGEQPEAYRKRIMAEELGVDHLSQVSATTGFDTLMARICHDAGDVAGAIKYALATAARYRRLIVDAAEILAPGNSLAYVAGVMIQSRTVCGYDQPTLAARLASDSGWLDLTVPQLRRLLAMLKTHLRRHE